MRNAFCRRGFCVATLLLIAISVTTSTSGLAATILGDSSTSIPVNYVVGAFPNGSAICWKMIGEPAGAGWKINNSTATSGSIPYTGGNVTVPIVTSGIGITPSTGSTTQSLQFAVANAMYFSCASVAYTNYPLLVDPGISISPTSVSLSAPASSSTKTITATINPIQNVNVTAACTGANGPSFTYVSAQTQAVNQSTGTATFTITASGLVQAYPQGTLSAYCSFSPSMPVSGGGTPNAATLNYQTLYLTPSISISPSVISVNGTTNVIATMSGGQGLWAGVSMKASCSQSTLPSGSSVSVVSPESTNNSGQAIFPVTATNLAFVDPNTSDPLPTPTCGFSWVTGTAQTTLSFTTANACSPSFGLSPRPAGCGDP